MCRFSLIHVLILMAALFIVGCDSRNNAAKSHECSEEASCNTIKSQEHSLEISYRYDKLSWLHDVGICSDSLMSDTVPNAFHRKGVYLDSLQIHRLIEDKIPNREELSISSIRLFSIKELSDSLFLCFYVYEFSDIEDIYMLLYGKNGEATDALKLPLPSESNIVDVVDGIEYIDYFVSNIEFLDCNRFVVIEEASTKGWNVENNKCVFDTSLVTKTYYVISANGKIHKEDVVKTQRCPG